jgi:methylmalonyl-CoA mutase N-terminal domain/subunit
MGGVLPAIENNFIKSEIHDSAYKFQKEIEQGTKIIVGLNKFETDEKIKLKPLSIDPKIEQDARSRLEALRRKRDNSKVSELLSTLEKAALTNENLLPLFIKMVESDVTLGEITGVLRKVWGEYIPSN